MFIRFLLPSLTLVVSLVWWFYLPPEFRPVKFERLTATNISCEKYYSGRSHTYGLTIYTDGREFYFDEMSSFKCSLLLNQVKITDKIELAFDKRSKSSERIPIYQLLVNGELLLTSNYRDGSICEFFPARNCLKISNSTD
ncbi:hypothetical protein ACOMICROBIO_LMKGKHOH_04119 [Vibrio sp. B1FIG11]|nr:hypothetical protein ACOMICROBIO_LMKGKHOH_04119 [Vibrio sp. B1FIG11]CAE6964197.1 hypothetical protein ACOMICROBIO_LMKGKHOH_04119 [Vibrio sp. B1FIG11]